MCASNMYLAVLHEEKLDENIANAWCRAPKSNICKSEQSWFGVVFRENHLKCDKS